MASQQSRSSTSTISTAESNYRLLYRLDKSSIIPSTILACTICNTGVEPRMVTESNIHPLFAVLLCETCRFGYDQARAYSFQFMCAWCAKIDLVYGCSSCCTKFCMACIKKTAQCACLICSPTLIWYQRGVCAAAKSYADYWNIRASVAGFNSVRNPSSEPTYTQFTVSGTVVTQSVASTANQRHTASSNLEANKHSDRLAVKYPVHTVSRGDQKATIARSNSVRNPASEPHCTQFTISGTVATQSVASRSYSLLLDLQEKTNLLEARINSLVTYREESQRCVICLWDPSIMVVCPCGHKCLCKRCSASVASREKRCPLCRTEFREIIRLYE